MISKEHRKHPKLARPNLGKFGVQEWAFVGAPCGVIQTLAKQLITSLSKTYAGAYVDASHQSPETPSMLSSGASIEYTDAIQFRQLMSSKDWGMHQFRALFNDCDFILVNGNHHQAAAQVVIIDPQKADSLKRRREQLSNVQLLLLKDKDTRIFDFLHESIADIDSIPCLMLDDVPAIVAFFETAMRNSIPPLNGLVLAGGQSQRMGRDKGSIEWHGVPQRDYLLELLKPVCEKVFISCRPEQEAEFKSVTETLPDSFLDLGPFGALLSAFRAFPDKAWLVLACDLPLMDKTALDFLVQSRTVKKIATAFQSPNNEFPEPLVTIWEPKAYAVLLSFLAQGYSCPRKVLINADTAVVQAPDPNVLMNVNTQADFEQMLQHPKFAMSALKKT